MSGHFLSVIHDTLIEFACDTLTLLYFSSVDHLNAYNFMHSVADQDDVCPDPDPAFQIV
jgi:hypothetical protein